MQQRRTLRKLVQGVGYFYNDGNSLAVVGILALEVWAEDSSNGEDAQLRHPWVIA
jgi:hypothetical protein